MGLPEWKILVEAAFSSAPPAIPSIIECSQANQFHVNYLSKLYQISPKTKQKPIWRISPCRNNIKHLPFSVFIVQQQHPKTWHPFCRKQCLWLSTRHNLYGRIRWVSFQGEQRLCVGPLFQRITVLAVRYNGKNKRRILHEWIVVFALCGRHCDFKIYNSLSVLLLNISGEGNFIHISFVEALTSEQEDIEKTDRRINRTDFAGRIPSDWLGDFRFTWRLISQLWIQL